MGDSQSFTRRRFVSSRWNALIQRHHDVAPNRFLRFDADLRTQQNGAAIDITLEDCSLFAHGTRMRQRKNLKPAGIGQDRFFPTHEPVDAAGSSKHLRPGTQEKVIGIGEKNLRPGILERLGKLRLHCRVCPNRHEERRVHFVMQGLKRCRARSRTCRTGFYAKIEAGRSHRGKEEEKSWITK